VTSQFKLVFVLIDGRLIVKFQKALAAIEDRDLLMQWAVGKDQISLSPTDGKCMADAVAVVDKWCYEVSGEMLNNDSFN
jgi:hypothetical protein